MRIELMDVYAHKQSCSWTLPCDYSDTCEYTLSEDRPFILALIDYDHTRRYALCVGDEELTLKGNTSYSVAKGVSRLELEKGFYFESAMGATKLEVLSRGEKGDERIELSTYVYVLPTKIGLNNYKRMMQDLQAVCAALVNDVRGKSREGTPQASPAPARAWRTHAEELDAVCATWRKLKPLLAEIKWAPKSRMAFTYQFGAPGRCHSPRTISTLMKRGLNPRHDTQMARVCPVGRLAESYDIPEHQLIKSFLQVLLNRLTNCREAIAKEMTSLEEDKKFRSRTSRANEQSLYELEDLPKIKHYQKIDALALESLTTLEDELKSDFWQGVHERIFSPENAQFSENEYYLAVANIILTYLRDTSHWGGTFGMRHIRKKTSLMYEQWILVQLVAAFGQNGVRMTSWDEIIRRTLDKQFGFDLAHNTTFSAPLGENYELRLRYTPWIMSREKAREESNETLCYASSHSDASAWSPDFVIELCQKKPQYKALYVVALDAKYSHKPSPEMTASVRKYAGIRTTVGSYGRRIARQVWLVHLGLGKGWSKICLEDDALVFKPREGPCYRDSHEQVELSEQIFGEFIVAPGARENEILGPVDEIGVQPKLAFLNFAKGTLAYFRRLIEARRTENNFTPAPKGLQS